MKKKSFFLCSSEDNQSMHSPWLLEVIFEESIYPLVQYQSNQYCHSDHLPPADNDNAKPKPLLERLCMGSMCVW